MPGTKAGHLSRLVLRKCCGLAQARRLCLERHGTEVGYIGLVSKERTFVCGWFLSSLKDADSTQANVSQVQFALEVVAHSSNLQKQINPSLRNVEVSLHHVLEVHIDKLLEINFRREIYGARRGHWVGRDRLAVLTIRALWARAVVW